MSSIPTTPQLGIGRMAAFLLCALTAFAPISMDVYLPVLPSLTSDLGSSASWAQLTVSACLLGLALGQLVAGPASDRFGRRLPLLVGIAAYVITSAACALSQSMEMLTVARFLQGMAGAAGIVIAQAAGRDVYSGTPLLRHYARLTVLGGVAAIAGPVLGGQLARVTDWRGIFWALSAVGVVAFVATLIALPETLRSSERRRGGFRESVGDYRALLASRQTLGAVLVSGFTYGALFAYLSAATFTLQETYGLSPQGYSYAFGLNSLGFVVLGFAGGRISERRSPGAALAGGLLVAMAGAILLFVTAMFELPLAAMIASLLLLVSGVAATSPPATTFALRDHPDMAGTAAAVLGLARFAFGAAGAALVGLGAVTPALGVVALTGVVLAVASAGLLRHRAASHKQIEAPTNRTGVRTCEA